MDKGKRWKCTLKNGEILYSDNKYDFYDSYYNLGKNVAHLEEFIEKSICSNCEQLQKSFDEAVEEICDWIVGNGEFIVRNHCPANLKRAIESHFSEQRQSDNGEEGG